MADISNVKIFSNNEQLKIRDCQSNSRHKAKLQKAISPEVQKLTENAFFRAQVRDLLQQKGNEQFTLRVENDLIQVKPLTGRAEWLDIDFSTDNSSNKDVAQAHSLSKEIVRKANDVWQKHSQHCCNSDCDSDDENSPSSTRKNGGKKNDSINNDSVNDNEESKKTKKKGKDKPLNDSNNNDESLNTNDQSNNNGGSSVKKSSTNKKPENDSKENDELAERLAKLKLKDIPSNDDKKTNDAPHPSNNSNGGTSSKDDWDNLAKRFDALKGPDHNKPATDLKNDKQNVPSNPNNQPLTLPSAPNNSNDSKVNHKPENEKTNPTGTQELTLTKPEKSKDVNPVKLNFPSVPNDNLPSNEELQRRFDALKEKPKTDEKNSSGPNAPQQNPAQNNPSSNNNDPTNNSKNDKNANNDSVSDEELKAFWDNLIKQPPSVNPLKTALKSEQDKNKKLEEQLQSKDKLLDENAKAYMSMYNYNGELQNTIQLLQDELSRLKQENANLESDLSQSTINEGNMGLKADDLQDRLRKANETLKQNQETIQNLELRIQYVLNRNTQIEESAAQSKEKAEQLIKGLSAEVTELKQQLSALREKFLKLQTENQLLKEQNTSLKRDNEQLKKRAEQLEHDNLDATHKAKNLERQNGDLSQKNKQLADQNNDLGATVESQKRKISSLDSDNKKLQDENKKLDEDSKDLKSNKDKQPLPALSPSKNNDNSESNDTSKGNTDQKQVQTLANNVGNITREIKESNEKIKLSREQYEIIVANKNLLSLIEVSKEHGLPPNEELSSLTVKKFDQALSLIEKNDPTKATHGSTPFNAWKYKFKDFFKFVKILGEATTRKAINQAIAKTIIGNSFPIWAGQLQAFITLITILEQNPPKTKKAYEELLELRQSLIELRPKMIELLDAILDKAEIV